MQKSKRTEKVLLNLTPKEREELESAAEKDHRPHSVYARLGALEKARRDLADTKRRPQREKAA